MLFLIAMAYLLVATEVHELFRLPVLFSHYTEHAGESPGLGFWEFIGKHYLEQEPHSGDHEDLPFSGQHLPAFPFVTDQCHPAMPVIAAVMLHEDLLVPHPVMSSGILVPSDIWQPPRA